MEGGQQVGQVNVWQGSDCGTKCGTVLAQNAAKQASAPVCEEKRFLPQTLVGLQVVQSTSDPVHIGHKCQWAHEDSNLRPRPYQGRALTN